MGKLEIYFEKAKALSGDRLKAFERRLEDFFEDAEWELSPEREAELVRRLGDPSPDMKEVSVGEAMFSKPAS